MVRSRPSLWTLVLGLLVWGVVFMGAGANLTGLDAKAGALSFADPAGCDSCDQPCPDAGGLTASCASLCSSAIPSGEGAALRAADAVQFYAPRPAIDAKGRSLAPEPSPPRA